MLRRLSVLVFAVAAFAAAGLQARAAPIVVDQWYTFGFGGVGSSLGSGAIFVQGVNPPSLPAPDTPWTFNLAGPGTLVLTDGFLSGDQFNVTDFGASIGNTSVPVPGADCGNDITACLASAANSKGTFPLAAGAHSISGTVLLSPFGGGAGFFIVQSTAAVPEPATLALFGTGLLGLGLLRRRRRA